MNRVLGSRAMDGLAVGLLIFAVSGCGKTAHDGADGDTAPASDDSSGEDSAASSGAGAASGQGTMGGTGASGAVGVGATGGAASIPGSDEENPYWGRHEKLAEGAFT